MLLEDQGFRCDRLKAHRDALIGRDRDLSADPTPVARERPHKGGRSR